MSDSLVVVGQDGRIAAVNAAILELLGYVEDELIGQIPEMLFAGGTFRGSGLETLHERGIVQRGEKTLMAKDGRQIPVFYSGSVLRNRAGQVQGIVCVAHDATKHKQLEQGLRDALHQEQELVRLKSHFVTTVSHEFRTPLAIIQSNSEMMRLYLDRMDAQQKTKSFDRVETQIQRMTHLLEAALTLEQMVEKTMPFNPVPIDMDRFCQEIVDALVNRVKRELVYTYRGDHQHITADKKFMEQIVMHLLTNAIKFSAPDSRVTLDLSCEAGGMQLQIQDQGIGIPEADQKRLFEPFFRCSNVGAIGGAGLGLAVTKEAVEMHGGTIRVTSQVGTGTTFSVVIPAR